MRVAILFLFLVASASFSADTPPDLSGKWTGTWLDTRPNTGHSGGPLWAVAVKAEKANEWKVTFRISKTASYDVLFKAKPGEKEKTLVFSGYANAGDARGLYYWTATLDNKELKGTYEGHDEKGTFILKRDAGSPAPVEAKAR
jgi:hypothetical protein